MKSEFVNLNIRQLSAETSHDFIEWCGLLEGTELNTKLSEDIKIYKQELYFDFTNEYPDYGPKSKMTISRTKFYKWLDSYCVYKLGYLDQRREGIYLVEWIILKSNPEEKDDTNQAEYIPF